jgi:cytochrome c-type biogenesis protein CcmH
VTVFLIVSAILATIAVALLAWPFLRSIRAGSGAPRGTKLAPALVAIVLPAAAFVIYFQASNWSWEPPTDDRSITAEDLRLVVAKLEQRLAAQPDDVEGWKLLGRTATVLGEFALAREAFGEAYTRTRGRDPDAVVGYAESLVLNDEREIDGHAADLFEQALALAPENPRALWYGGIVAYRRGDVSLAERRWVELQNQGELAPELRQFVAERLAEIGSSAGAPAGDSAAEAAAGIEIAIDIDPTLVSKARPRTPLFVIARRGSGGPPIAVVRRSVGAWPVTVTMSDADAMLPGTSLAQGGAVTLIARISQGGAPTASSGDLFGEVRYDFASAHPARITIDRIVP